jgi:hypothetical protein
MLFIRSHLPGGEKSPITLYLLSYIENCVIDLNTGNPVWIIHTMRPGLVRHFWIANRAPRENDNKRGNDLVKYIVYCVFTPLNLLRVLSPWGLPCTQKKVDGFWCEKAHSPIHEILVLFLWHNWSLDIPLSLETLIDLMGSPVQVVFRLKLLLKRSVFD